MFPQGGPGIALLLLRMSVGAMVLLGAWPRFSVSIPHWTLWILILVLIGLFLGILTPVLALVCCLLEIAACFSSDTADARAILNSVQAASLALLGPGAYSIDARLFGRRVLVVPPGKSSRFR
jgi:hypothetical protein